VDRALIAAQAISVGYVYYVHAQPIKKKFFELQIRSFVLCFSFGFCSFVLLFFCSFLLFFSFFHFFLCSGPPPFFLSFWLFGHFFGRRDGTKKKESIKKMSAELASLCIVAYEARLNARKLERLARVRTGQVVYVRSAETSAPYIARVRSVRNGTARMQWFYRPTDIPPRALIGAPEPAPNELFVSNLFDDNPVETILGPCALSSAPTDPSVYFSRRSFTGSRIRPN
jgi:hypothetical protein